MGTDPEAHDADASFVDTGASSVEAARPSPLPGPDAAAAPVLELDGLSVAYRTRGRANGVLDAVSLTIRPGEAVGLVGESGCGKSTLALSLMRALPPNGTVTGGRIAVSGTDVLALNGAALRQWRGTRAAMVYQDPTGALTPTMTVGAQVAEVYRHHEGLGRTEARERAGAMLHRVALEPARFLGRYPHELSGGQRQRVVIAMALAARPRLLILDEPTTGLDATVEAGVLELLESLRGEFIDGLLFITHNLDLVARTCERVAVLYAGRIVEEGPVDGVLREPAHPYAAALVACVPGPKARVDRVRLPQIPGAPPAPGEVLPGCSFAPRCPIAAEECTAAEPELVPYPVPRDDVANGRSVRCLTPGRPEVVRLAPPAPPAPRESEVLLELRGVGKRYGETAAAEAVDLTIRRHETVGLVGESGSGKTTLARIIAGLTPPDEGELRWAGERLAGSVARRPRRLARALQLVPQHPDSTLNPRHRVHSILRRAVRRLGGTRPVEELADAVRLEPHHLDSRADELSGGLKQRAAIARAFAGRPELVVCDEPVSALDVSVQAAILNLLADLQAEGGTSYVFISHDLAVVRYLAHRIAVIYGGRIVEVGETDEVFTAPHHPYTDALVSAAPLARTRAAPLRPLPADGAAAERAAAGGTTAHGATTSGTTTGGATAHGTAVNGAARGCVFAARCPVKLGDICESEEPPWREEDSGHAIRCHIPPAELTHLQPRR